ncbi:HalOD1 output domain-containing protein [Halopiger goleimassiliensis]|uniref:HalOD1 output domain-containing protein n=1 Tax=Halopiger goleimassiliensis TaxID=1293048 RepID=UPI000677A07C|nr:HalOD1 output domain-containing protein [Halopiger goleimassiliensis]
MGASENDEVRIWYDPRRDRELSDALVSAIAKAKNADLDPEECALFQDVDPDSLDALFRESGTENTSLTFNTNDTVVRIDPGTTFEIRAASLTTED